MLSALKYASLLAASAFMLVPMLVILFNSLKSNDELFSGYPLALPHGLHLSNYATAWTDGNMARGFLNTGIILVVSLVGNILVASMTAYALDRFEFRGKKLVLAGFVVATLIPGITTQVAVFQIVNHLGLFNTRWSAILLFLGTDIISIYIFLQFLRGIPRELDEAAALDGANVLSIFFRIIFPLLRPAIATVCIVKGVAIYNDFFVPFLYMPKPELQTVSTSLYAFQGPYGGQWEIISAAIVIIALPSLVLFLALQRYVYNGFTSGATK
ncbi:carbohydrate ABC transporter permease [Motilibacter rhizosphaerae]